MIKVTNNLISKISKQAVVSKRKRINYNFHSQMSDPLQRLLNAIEPESYIQPHKHENPDKREIFFILHGSALVVEFDNTGNIIDHIVLNIAEGNYAVEIPEKTWHTIIALENNTVAYEFKDGPYSPLNDKNFASWAPKEGTDESEQFNLKILNELKIELKK